MTKGKLQAGGLIQNDHLAMIGIMDVPSCPGVGGKLFSALSDQGINVELIVHLIDLEEKDHIVLCVDRDNLSRALAVAERVREEIGGKAITRHPEVAFKALGDCNINIRAISTSISTISCLIEAQHLDKAVRALRDAFTLP